MDINETLLLEERMDADLIKEIGFSWCRQNNQSVKEKDGILEYDMGLLLTFPNKKMDKSLELKEQVKKEVEKILKSDKLMKFVKKCIFDSKAYFSSNNKIDEDLFNLEFKLSNFKVTHCPYNDYWNIDVDLKMTYDLAEWWTKSIVKAETKKSFFFKNYKIKYFWDLNPLVRAKTNNWKEICVKVLDWSLFHKGELKAFMQKLTHITMNDEKVDFDITFNDSSNEIKLVLMTGIAKWLTKFGISGFWAKYIIAGLTIYGVLKLLKNKDEEDWKKAKKKFDRFLD